MSAHFRYLLSSLTGWQPDGSVRQLQSAFFVQLLRYVVNVVNVTTDFRIRFVSLFVSHIIFRFLEQLAAISAFAQAIFVPVVPMWSSPIPAST